MAVTSASGGHYAGVSPCGTAFTRQHVTALQSLVDLDAAGVLVAFDADSAGLHAAVRTYELLKLHSSKASAVVLPPEQDPAHVLAKYGPAALDVMLKRHTRPLADLVVDAEVDKWSRWLCHPEGQINALHAVARLMAGLALGDVARQVARLSERLGLSHGLVTEAVAEELPVVIAHSSGYLVARHERGRQDPNMTSNSNDSRQEHKRMIQGRKKGLTLSVQAEQQKATYNQRSNL
jgi:DNA primase